MRKESGPALDRIHGNASDEEKKALEVEMEKRHDDRKHSFEKVTPLVLRNPQKSEREKSPEEIKIIAMANAATDRIRERYGLEPHAVPEENVVFADLHPFWTGPLAFYTPTGQAIVLSNAVPENKLAKAHVIVHEMIHMKSYSAQSVKQKRSGEVEPVLYRTGLVTKKSEGADFFDLEDSGFYFIALNEAITERLAKRTMKELENDPFFAEEVAEKKRLSSAHPDEVPEDVLCAWEEQGIFGKKIAHDGEWYAVAIRALDMLVDKLYARFPGEFPEREAAFDLFGRAAITGRMLLLGRWLKKAFGEDAFRKLAEAGSNGGKLLKAVESL